MLSIITPIVANLILWLWIFSALLLVWITRGRRRARAVGIVFLLLVWSLSIRPTAETALKYLENRYDPPSLEAIKAEKIRQIVVLTGGGYTVQGALSTAAFPHASAYRFWSGLELAARLGPETKLVFSGSAGRSNRDCATAVIMADLARLLMPNRTIQAEARSGSTEEHPQNVKPLVGDRPFLLVTSALHMPRAMRSFEQAGLKAVAYPVDFLAIGDYGWQDFLPSAESLWKLNIALREYQANVLYWLMRW